METPIPVPSLTVYCGAAVGNHYVASPFVLKLETRLRLSGFAYRTEFGSLLQAPRGKVPFVKLESPAIVEGEKGKEELLTDSALITERLVRDGHIADWNSRLTGAERAKDVAVRALLEDRWYFFAARERWMDNYYAMRDDTLGFIPWPFRVVLGLVLYRKIKDRLDGQGALRYTDEEAAAAGAEAWENVNELLVESHRKAQEKGKVGPFWVLGGPQPTEADATVFGFIVGSLDRLQAPATEKVVRGFPVMMEYARRIHDAYFSDYKRWTDGEVDAQVSET
ncbi:uncharacterized protein C8A04DRAFT_32700 [Dichotomopilus funicola]|uniref:Thioredoxin-like fold domain-containing protein n=1 Tax=Dichotomopilus funicola TaxID=1934379 RepID=A0AAN6UV48_9PEZI|nr:hypothetical protein C8A04DRAFT_32700 [Dichotomopilus funicola]